MGTPRMVSVPHPFFVVTIYMYENCKSFLIAELVQFYINVRHLTQKGNNVNICLSVSLIHSPTHIRYSLFPV